MRLYFHSTLRIALLSVLILIVAYPTYSQTTGRIVGSIKDAANEEDLQGVNVTIVGTFLGSATDQDGRFVIINVPVGTYDVKASMMGYTEVTQNGVRVSIDRNTSLDFELQEEVIGGKTVTIIADRNVLHPEVSNSQQVIDANQFIEAAGIRTINQYLGSQAGITNERLLEVRGGSAEQTGTIVNGLSFNNPRLGRSESSIPLSAIEQVSLQAGGFGAEYGNFRSGILNVVTKSGSKDSYHGTFSYSRNQPHMRRFGKSMYDPTNVGLRPYMDPVVSFEGTDTGWLIVTGGDEEEAAYLKQQHEPFKGWNIFVDRYNRDKPEDEQATPMDLYLWNAWIHQAIPDFEKLEELYPQYIITETQKKALRDHAHKPEDEFADWDMDFGFGGPMPFISGILGDATFYLSHKSTNFNYVQPVMRPSEKVHTTMLTVESKLSESMRLKINGIYRQTFGSQSDMPTDGNVLDLENGGDTMPMNNLDIYTRMGMDYFWHPTFYQSKNQKTYIAGLTLNKVLSQKSFWDLAVSYARTRDIFEPKETRNHEALVNFGPIWLNEMPYGILFSKTDTVYNPNDPSEYTVHDVFSTPYGQSSRRFSAKVGQFHENSLTQQFRAKFDLSSQINRTNFIKTGVELNYYDMNNNNWRWWNGSDTNYELRDHRKPWQLGAYIQDQISVKGMEAKIGLRVDYYNSGGGVWPSGDVYNEAAFTSGTEADDLTQLYADLLSGKQVIWSRWRQIDEEMGGTLLEPTKNFLTFSPRIGISFPVTERSKFFFNYGHFRSLVPYPQQFQYKFRMGKQGLYLLGNPNLEPARTISYELGVAYNLGDEYLLELTTYYKDISGEAATIHYYASGQAQYDTYLNNRWEKDQGFEFKLTKSYGRYLTGWFNFWYVIDNNGNVGRDNKWENDPARNATDPTAFYADDKNEPQYLPRLAANVSLHSPDSWGSLLGQWMLSMLPKWRRGEKFTFNPLNIRNLQNNLRWPDYFVVDMKLSKSFHFQNITTTFYVDVNNVFNNKVNWMNQFWAFRAGEDQTDYNRYFKSLHLSIYDSPEYDNDRELHPGWYIAGNDKVGDLRSDSKPYINDPDINMFLYGEPRSIWVGARFDF